MEERGVRLRGTNGTVSTVQHGVKARGERNTVMEKRIRYRRPSWKRGCHPGPRVLVDRDRDPCHFGHPLWIAERNPSDWYPVGRAIPGLVNLEL